MVILMLYSEAWGHDPSGILCFALQKRFPDFMRRRSRISAYSDGSQCKYNKILSLMEDSIQIYRIPLFGPRLCNNYSAVNRQKSILSYEMFEQIVNRLPTKLGVQKKSWTPNSVSRQYAIKESLLSLRYSNVSRDRHFRCRGEHRLFRWLHSKSRLPHMRMSEELRLRVLSRSVGNRRMLGC